MSTFESKLDPLDPKYGVNLEKYPNDKEKTWSFPAERDGFVNYCNKALTNKIFLLAQRGIVLPFFQVVHSA